MSLRSNKDFGEGTKKDNRATSLKVAEAEQRDVGRKIARVDPKVAERLNITSGDALELSSLGKKTTVLSSACTRYRYRQWLDSYRWLRTK